MEFSEKKRPLDQESNNFLAPVLSKDGVVVYASATASSALAQWDFHIEQPKTK